MTRMWGIDPTLLCDQHLLGEHSELHQVVGTLRNHPHGKAIIKGHAEKNQIDTTQIKERHEELATEMERRGIDHSSPLEYSDALQLGSINCKQNRVELQERCADCRKRIEEAMEYTDE
ncbi:MAG: pyrimidine dimer DNA glycosylase/endonuclease V [Halobacteriaceae archaeon]